MQTLYVSLLCTYCLLEIASLLEGRLGRGGSHVLKYWGIKRVRYRGAIAIAICLLVGAGGVGWLALRAHHRAQVLQEANARKSKHDFNCAAVSLAAALIYERRGLDSNSARSTYDYFSARPGVDASAVPLRAQLMIGAAGGDLGKEATDILANAMICTDAEIVEVGTRNGGK